MRNAILTGLNAAAKATCVGLLIALACPAAAVADSLPSLFAVSGVAADDVLNIRAEPNGGAAILGTLAPGARDVEVVAYDDTGQWAQVNTAEASGWAAQRFLAYQDAIWTPQTLPPTLRCLGTEPFWSFAPQGNAIVFSTPDDPSTPLAAKAILSTYLPGDTRRSIVAQDSSQHLTAVMVPMACSDGMSDRAYGLDVTVILENADGIGMLTGCCSISPH